jgi:hypothetical protein
MRYFPIAMKKKSHQRAPDKRNFSVALPITLIDQIEAIAKSETRSRNRQIEHFLQECVRNEKQKKTGINALPNFGGKSEAAAS